MTDFVLTRHGETPWHEENRYAGRTDVPLTEHGHQQAELLARWAVHADISACVSSPLKRARATMAPAARATGLDARSDDRLVELDFGEGEGLTSGEMSRTFRDRHALFQHDPISHHLPGGEDPRTAVHRATSCLSELAGELPQGRVLVVWHSTVMRLVLCHLLGIPLSEYRRVFPFVRNSGLTEIRLVDGVCSLLEFNTPIEPSSNHVDGPPPPGAPRSHAATHTDSGADPRSQS
ncbi:MAG: histidine phosphatase family protein [Marmoricola sp.]